MNQQQQRQSYQLRQNWKAEDYATQAQQSAYAASQYYQLTDHQIGAFRLELARLSQTLEELQRSNQRLARDNQGLRHTCLIWGMTGAIVTSFVATLILAAQPQPAPIQRTPQIGKVRYG